MIFFSSPFSLNLKKANHDLKKLKNSDLKRILVLSNKK